MTIISTVYVPEGIVLAADSRLTGYRKYDDGLTERFTISDNAQKIVLLRNSTIGVVYCGDSIIDGKTLSDFLRLFDIENVEAIDSVENTAFKLSNKLKQYVGIEVFFILAGYDNDIPYVYDVSKDHVNRLNYSEGKINYATSWNGDKLPVTNLLADIKFNFDLMPLKDAVDLSEFIAEVAIKYWRFADQISTCGGPIDILVITKDYTEFYRHKILKP